jgi:hypothetical protein
MVGNTIPKVRSGINSFARRNEGWSLLEKKDTSARQTMYNHYNPSIIDSRSECGYVISDDGTKTKYVIGYNNKFGWSNINIYRSSLGFSDDYEYAFVDIDANKGDSDAPGMKKTLTHVRAGASKSTDCCLWLAAMTMIAKYDNNVSRMMQEMLEKDNTKFRHMWILKSHVKKEDTFDAIMQKCFGYYLRKRTEQYLFSERTRGLFVCLLKESEGRMIHAVAVEKSNVALLYDFEDEYPFHPTKRLDNFHGLCNSRKCEGVQIVAELVPPKRKTDLFPFLSSINKIN